MIEGAKTLHGRSVDVLGCTDRQTTAMDACSHLELIEGIGLFVGTDLLLDDAPLLLHLEAIQCQSCQPITEDECGAIQHVWLIGGKGKHIDGAVMPRHGIEPDSIACP